MRRALLIFAVAVSIAALAPNVYACHGGDGSGKGKAWRHHCWKKKPSSDAATTQPAAAPEAPKTEVKPDVKTETPAVIAPPAPPVSTPPPAASSAAPSDGKSYKSGDFGTGEEEAGK